MAKLILTSGEQRQEFELAPINTIGRHPDNSIQILDRIISKEHAQILRGGDGRFLLRDLGSLNGTYVSGSRVSEHPAQARRRAGAGLDAPHVRRAHRDRGVAQSRDHRARRRPESIVRHKVDVAQANRDFLPEKQIADVEHLRRDYEKLRIAHELGRAIVGVLDLDAAAAARSSTRRSSCSPADRGVILLYDQDGQADAHATSSTRPGASDEQIVLSKSIIAEVEQQKKAVLSSDATMDCALLRRALDHHAGHPLDHERAAASRRRAARHHAPGLADRDQRVHREGSAALHRHRQPGRGRHPERAAGQEDRDTRPRRARSSSGCCRRTSSSSWSRGKLHLEKGGELREVTILFSDIRGFTVDVGEEASRPRSSHMLNEYFELMVDVLFKHEGTLDKFVGDEIMALFGAPVAMPDAPLNAVRCARRHAEGAARVQPHARRRGPGADQDRHRHQHRPRGHRRHRLVAHAAVHGHRRRGEHRVAAVLDRQARRDHPVARRRCGAWPTTSTR